MERKMATVRRIDAIEPIENADQIEVAVVGGWKIVVKKGEYTPGTLAVYLEIDSFVPHALAPFLTEAGKYPKVYNQVEGQRLRTKKLRGVISQGLLLPMSTRGSDGLVVGALFDEGSDVSEFLGVQKWEPPAEFLPANSKGNFPHFIQKTDQERIQNLAKELREWSTSQDEWQVTEKLDGSSMTVFIHEGTIGVCSRNLELKEDEQNTFWATAIGSGTIQALKDQSLDIAIQGELIGGSIQGNAYKVVGFEYCVYDIYDIHQQRYWLPTDVESFCKQHGLKHVPVLESEILEGATIQELLSKADGQSVVGAKPKREGLVYKHKYTPNLSFKVVSNSWLIKNGG